MCVCVAAMRIYGALPGWNTSYLSFVTTSDTKLESALAKNGTDATRDLQNDINFFFGLFVSDFMKENRHIEFVQKFYLQTFTLI